MAARLICGSLLALTCVAAHSGAFGIKLGPATKSDAAIQSEASSAASSPVNNAEPASSAASAGSSAGLYYQETGARQCEPGSGTSLAIVEKALAKAGVKAAVRCGGMSDVMLPAMCGAKDGSMYFVSVSAAEASKMQVLGFMPVSSLDRRVGQPVFKPCK